MNVSASVAVVIGLPIKGGMDGYSSAGALGCAGEFSNFF